MRRPALAEAHSRRSPSRPIMRILIVAETKAVRRAIRTALEGFWPDSTTIFEAEDGPPALATLSEVQGRMDLVLCDWKLPLMNGITFLKKLQGMSLAREVPVIVIANDADRDEAVEALRWGARDLIVRPFTAQVLKEKTIKARERVSGDTAIMLQNIAGHRRRAEASDMALPGLSGSLDTLGIPDLIQILNGCRKTGHLRLRRGVEEAGIFFSSGEACHAWTKDLEGEEAFFLIISWKDAHFSFDSGLKPEEPTLNQPTMTLLFEGLRKLDESGR
jgi:two-component system, chemotaxis family, chemotaxis protein CheY